jgi:hypothetical protein
MGLPIKVQRRLLGMRLRDGQTRWFPDFSCRPAGNGTSPVDACAAELNKAYATSRAAEEGGRP